MTDPAPGHRAFPADGFEARWTTWDGRHGEDLSLRWDNEAWTATGAIERERVEYVIRLSPLWQVRQYLLFRDLADPDLWLGTDGHGRWGEMNGVHRAELTGALDITMASTPFPHTVPIRRIQIGVGASVALTVLDVDVETLGVVPRALTYRRVGDRRWHVAGPDRTIEFEVDEYGLSLDIDGAFRRVA